MFTKVLVANRGEIAVRVMRTLKEMDIKSVAIYSDADKDALHVQLADEAICLGESDPASSYLNIDKIVDAIKTSGAEAVHPGYGFLSENPLFPKRLAKEGITFIGPPAEVMEKLGDKTSARTLMRKSGVPIIPGMDSTESDILKLTSFANDIGYPVLIKASAGGGGKGMRIVNSSDELAESAELAMSEAKSAFGDGSIFIEKYIEEPRHVEFQIFCDTYGNAVHMFERECSIQRRHQKIIEETPSVAVSDALREKMGEAAIAVAKASDYVNAGTVEFLLDKDSNFYFLEVNTRLQVEHPITEQLTGLDLVRLQLMVANGETLPLAQKDLTRRGHSIECRVYAEDPENNFFPTPGRILFTKAPEGPGIRLDTGVFSGYEVPLNYDPIISKLIVTAENREAAILKMIKALEDYPILGIKTPVEFLMEILKSEAFKEGETYTNFIEKHCAEWKSSDSDDEAFINAYIANDRFAPVSQISMDNSGKKDEFPSPWIRLGKWDISK